MKFLIIDDNPDDRELTRLQLLGGFPGSEFVEVGRRADLEPALSRGDYDLVFLDYYLQWGNGLLLLKEIRARMPEVPVVMLTDSGTEEVAIDGMKSGLSDYVLKGRLHRLPVVVRETLERERLRREHGETQRRLAELVEELSESNRRKDEFLAMLGHELRNPLAPIMSALELIRDLGHDPAAVQEAREIAERQVRHMCHLIDDLLDVSRVTRGLVSLRKGPVEIRSVIDRAVESVRPLIGARAHHLTVHPPSHPVALEADATRLEQVLVNLLSNAAKYTEPGGSIGLSAGLEEGHLVVRVVDTGSGIEPDLLPRVFEPFLQGKRSLARSEGGLGLGLTLARRLVELHGGTIEARSDGPGQGSEFTVRFPGASLPPAPPAPVAAAAPASSNGRPLRVLVVDDNEDAAVSLTRLMAIWRHEARLALDGPSALEAAEAFHPDVILLDLGLPGMSGYEVAGHLRSRSKFDQTHILALTGYGQEEDRLRTRQAGFDAHLVKPVDFAVLRSLLRPRGE